MAETSVNTGPAQDIWLRKDDLAKTEWEARQYWAALPDETRSGLALIVIDQLARLVADVDRWLPASACPGDEMEISIRVLLPEVDRAGLKDRVTGERSRIERGNRLREMEKRFRD